MKINDKSFSFLGDFSETVMRGIFIALIPVAIIVLIGMILWARSQNAVTKDPNERKQNNLKVWGALSALIIIIVMWPLIELIKSNVKKPSGSGAAQDSLIKEVIQNGLTLKLPKLNLMV
ncbi:hypothetical protein PR257_01130 [Metamycoplasma hyosynoviae]|uniref:Mbov_0395 family pilin-like conjugal transfer protein n=1 Tax=Metamycoplasma hyosynoviae TaxID=29559 RepID=UPI0023582A6D|nr:hypothetical protein [Metamycoplasma hyosynoviae]MDC8921630.1 hypothetical protein [Metamycoplasma hyosynoviae]